ncbi:restriction endonuclease subunit S [Congregibacter brevis]|uniref:Restriction endonuclease subunit S n=1 Tax=Congregibacter brevis TaxID=3081201 RepID=A0ABZ0I8T6_9GAMM|nr:restriction endonuclease subunit S [Congregibacter sp. IMCC45268]
MNFSEKVPKLRFPEHTTEYITKPLAQVFSNTGGTSLEDQVSVSGTHKFISIGNYSKDGNYIDNSQRIPLNDKTRAKLLNKGDLVMVLNDKTKTGDIIGSSILIESNDAYIYNQRSEKLVLRREEFSSKYCWFLLNTPKQRKDVFKISQGGTQIYVNFSAVKTLSISFPTLPEQQKIADFLTSIDKRTAQLTEKKALLEDYKKGVMQQIFSQATRFKDDNGDDFPDWEEKTLGGVGKITTGKTPSTSDDTAWVGDTMFVTPSDIGEDTKFQYKTSRHVNGEKLRLIPKGSLMFTCIASVGKMSIATKPCITNQQINSVSVGSGFLFEYVYYALRNLTPRIKATQANTTLPIINKTEFSKVALSFPSLPEQTKIANFLSAIDRKLDTVTSQITETQSFKRGLLQQMFV